MNDKQWYLVKFYYYLNVDQLEDPFGDHVLQHLTKPLFADVKAQNLADYAVFMRFSEGGAHIRMRFFIAPAVQPQLDALISQYADAYCQQYRDYLQYEMKMSPVGEIINRKLNHGNEDYTLHQPGDLVRNFVANTQGLEGVDDNDRSSRLQDALCSFILEFFSLSPSNSVRKLFVRMLVVDLIELLKITPDNLYRVLSFLKNNWITYFNLSGIIGEYFEKYEANKSGYQKFFVERIDIDQSYKLLPQRFQQVYQDGLATLTALIEEKSPIEWEENGDLSMPSFMNVYSYFHLNHNRSDVSLFQEVFWAHVLIDYYSQFLTQAQQGTSDEWLKNAYQMVEQPPNLYA